MKKINLFIILFTGSFFFSHGQENTFERTLNKFRFSLHEELEKYEDEKIRNIDFNQNDTIILLINNFVFENKDKIRAYRENILERYENNSDFEFDASKYEKIDASELNENIKNINLASEIALSKLLWIDPIIETSSLKTIYISRKKGAAKLAAFNARNIITSSLIKTLKINHHQWEIIDNSYDIVSKFIYDLNKGSVIKIEIFERKKNN